MPGGRVQFLDKANGNAAQPGPDATSDAGPVPAGGDPMDGDYIPF